MAPGTTSGALPYYWFRESLARHTTANDSTSAASGRFLGSHLVESLIHGLDGLMNLAIGSSNQSVSVAVSSTRDYDLVADAECCTDWAPNGSCSDVSSACKLSTTFDNSPSASTVADAVKAVSSIGVDQLGGAGLVQRVDELVSRTVFRSLEAMGLDINRPSPITKDLPLVSSPTGVVLLVLLYILVVVVAVRLMKHAGAKPKPKDPWLLRALVLVHNLFLAVLSLFMGSGILHHAWRNGYSVWGNKVRDEEDTLGRLIYLFYVSKLYEFVDTLIMLLKRNLWQVSFLHVYHHGTISLVWWIMCYRSYFSAAMNSWIHVAMYMYYFLAAVLGKDEKKRKKYLFWGKYLTIMQMVQFVLFIVQSVYGIWYPNTYPRGIAKLLFFYSLSLLVFFGNFYMKKHIAPSKKLAAMASLPPRKAVGKEE
ncbi:hypothetical protein CBR_g48498 [Chara braunii]|uniref:Uncharacterized protein n=1 Tax=Chara braunii TaxID=69332 RepID=A0A388M2W6_CHABU|nr:hypothetical protein CBR_g48498 [Chara braunii]|eukprot:GBG88886.1 hypothetical protein CBR_g48498 [Chara braunii]